MADRWDRIGGQCRSFNGASVIVVVVGMVLVVWLMCSMVRALIASADVWRMVVVNEVNGDPKSVAAVVVKSRGLNMLAITCAGGTAIGIW